MRVYVNKLLLFLMSMTLMMADGTVRENIAAMLAAICCSALCSYLEDRKRMILPCIFCCAACFAAPVRYFLPLVIYDSIDGGEEGWKRFRFSAFCLLPFLSAVSSGLTGSLVRNILFCFVSLLIGDYEIQSARHVEKFIGMRDETREKALSLESRNKELQEKQDYEVQLATLRERNRIAREIHDNVGHLLTRSIYQVSALQVMYGGEEELNSQLVLVRQTLSDAMDNIRNSVHNLHEESIDLCQQLTVLTQQFGFCPVTLNYDAGTLPKEIKYMAVAVVKEALANIVHHSNATRAEVSFVEHPGLYQLIISDNGRSVSGRTAVSGQSRGIGLQNMEERVRALGGVFRIDNQGGYRVFISVPRKPADAGERRI